MEEWTYVEAEELESFCGNRACMTCSYFTYGVDISCRTLVACRLRQQQLVQGEHLTKQCRHWLPVWAGSTVENVSQ